jgi:carbon-monoxide dehydrogenase medium subunit
VTLDDNGAIERVGIGLTNVDVTPIRAARSEDTLRGRPLTDEAIREAAELAAADSDPQSDLRGPAEYKRDMIRVLTMRALRRAVERAQS